MAAPARELTRRAVATYAIGSIGTGGFTTLPGLVLVFYLTDTLGLPVIAAGAVVTVAKIWDVIIDPVVGNYSDRMLRRTGSRRRLMVSGALSLPVLFILTFAVPRGMTVALTALWVLCAFLGAATAFSLFQVPYIALPAELTPSYDERTRLLTWRVVVLTFAILLFGAGGPALRSSAGADPAAGYLSMAVIAGVVIGSGMLISSFVAPRLRGPTDAATSPSRGSLLDAYARGARVLRDSQPFRALLLTFSLQGLAVGEMLAATNYVAFWVLRSTEAVTFLFAAFICPALLATQVWQRVSRSVGKEKGYAIASVTFIIAVTAMTALLWAPSGWVYLVVAVAGTGYAGMQSLPMAMLPDVISHDMVRHRADRAGIFGGLWTAGETTGLALGASVLTGVLALTGYTPQTATADPSVVTGAQPASALTGIVLCFSLVPAVIMVLSLIPLTRYHLRKADIET